MSKIKESKTLQNVLWTILILLVWEIVSRTEIVNSYILPPFSTVVTQMLTELVQGNLLLQILNSLYIVLLGFLISFVIASIVTIGCVYSKIFESFFYDFMHIV